MIRVTRLNGKDFYLNPELIEHVESTPDTLIKLRGSSRYLVRESPETVIERIVAYRRKCFPDEAEAEKNLSPRGRFRQMEKSS